MLSFHNFSVATESGNELLKLDTASQKFELPLGVHLLAAPNGMGKSTLFQRVAGIRKGSGSVKHKGQRIEDCYYFSEYIRIPRYIYPMEWIDFLSQGRGSAEKIQDWIQKFRLEPVMNRVIGRLSQGERRKLEWIAAAYHPADIILLDEPLDGLDLLAIDVVHQILQHLKKEGKLVWMISHQAGEIFPALDSVQVIRNQQLENFAVREKDNALRSNDFSSFQNRLLEFYHSP